MLAKITRMVFGDLFARRFRRFISYQQSIKASIMPIWSGFVGLNFIRSDTEWFRREVADLMA
jgi:hypothetical protein